MLINPGQESRRLAKPNPLDSFLLLSRALLILTPGVAMDAFALCKAGVLKTSQSLELGWAFKSETE